MGRSLAERERKALRNGGWRLSWRLARQGGDGNVGNVGGRSWWWRSGVSRDRAEGRRTRWAAKNGGRDAA